MASKPLTKHTSRDSSKSSSNKDESRKTTERECEHVYQGIKRWKAHDGAVLLPVVRKSTVSPLNERAKPRWWKKKSMSRSLSWDSMIPIPAMLNLSLQHPC